MDRLSCLFGLLAGACLAAVLGFASGGHTPQQPNKGDGPPRDVDNKDRLARPQVEDEDPRKIETMLKYSEKHAVRQNGVRLTAKVSVIEHGKSDVIRIDWTIDYAGPRFPLNILKPALRVGWFGQTRVDLYWVDEKGIAHLVPIHPRVTLRVAMPGKDGFLTVKKGQVATGTITVGWKVPPARKHEGGKSALQAASLFVRLRHMPADRGERFDLDAWTGSLQTPLLPVLVETEKSGLPSYGTIRVAGGSNYMAHQLVPLYIVLRPRHEPPTDGMALTSPRATAKANANGEIEPLDIGPRPADPFWLIADYDQDGNYNRFMDAATFYPAASKVSP